MGHVMPSLAPITVTTAWVAVQSGPFTGRISNLSGAQLYVRVATSLPTSLDGSVPLAVGMSVQLAAGETLYARAYDRAGTIQVDPELITVASPPLNLMTSKGGQYARLRVDPDQTSFWQGTQYRTFREINIAQGATEVLKIVVPVNTVLYDVSLTLDAGATRLRTEGGAIRLRTVAGGTEGGTFATPLPILRKNNMSDAPNIPAQNAITTGGTHTGGTDIDVIRLVVADATAQQSSIGSKAYDQRGVGPGTYYWKLENISDSTATGVFSAFWEERRLPY